MIEAGSKVQIISDEIGNGALVGLIGTVLSVTPHFYNPSWGDEARYEEGEPELDYNEYKVQLDKEYLIWDEWTSIYYCMDEEIMLVEPRKPSGFAVFVRRVEDTENLAKQDKRIEE